MKTNLTTYVHVFNLWTLGVPLFHRLHRETESNSMVQFCGSEPETKGTTGFDKSLSTETTGGVPNFDEIIQTQVIDFNHL